MLMCQRKPLIVMATSMHATDLPKRRLILSTSERRLGVGTDGNAGVGVDRCPLHVPECVEIELRLVKKMKRADAK